MRSCACACGVMLLVGCADRPPAGVVGSETTAPAAEVAVADAKTAPRGSAWVFDVTAPAEIAPAGVAADSQPPASPPEPVSAPAQPATGAVSEHQGIANEARRQLAPEDAAPSTVPAAALEAAAAKGQHVFVLFRREPGEALDKMREAVRSAARGSSGRAISLEVDIADQTQEAVVRHFRAERAPLPLALVVAPNGVVTAGFPREVSAEQLVGAMAGPCLQKCLAALQTGRLVLLCVQGPSTTSNDVAMRGVREFAAEGRFKDVSEIVTVDPRDEGEADLLAELKMSPTMTEATTIVLAPPGAAIARIAGATTRDALEAAVDAAMSSGCGAGSSCGPSGCR